MEDKDVYNDIPSDWWLSPDSKGRLLLSCMVHKKNKEIAPLCNGHKRRKNRVSQREEKKMPEFRKRGMTTERKD